MNYEYTLIVRDNDTRDGRFLNMLAFKSEDERERAKELIYETQDKFEGDWTMDDIYEAWEDAKLDCEFIFGEYDEIWI